MTRTQYTLLFAVVGAAVALWSKRPAAGWNSTTGNGEVKGTDTLATTPANRQGDAQRITM